MLLCFHSMQLEERGQQVSSALFRQVLKEDITSTYDCPKKTLRIHCWKKKTIPVYKRPKIRSMIAWGTKAFFFSLLLRKRPSPAFLHTNPSWTLLVIEERKRHQPARQRRTAQKLFHHLQDNQRLWQRKGRVKGLNVYQQPELSYFMCIHMHTHLIWHDICRRRVLNLRHLVLYCVSQFFTWVQGNQRFLWCGLHK